MHAVLIAMIGVAAVLTGAEAGGAADASVPAAGPFFMFAASNFAESGERQAIEAALAESLTSRDFVSLGLTRAFPAVAGRVPRGNVFVLPPNLTQVSATIRKGAGDGTPGLIIYDGEHWDATPGEEQRDLPAAVVRGKVLVSKSPGHRFGFSPDGIFVGVRPSRCGFDLDEAVHRKIDWTGIALFNIQAQALLGDNCRDVGGPAAYLDFVSAVARDVKRAAPNLVVTAQLSFRHTPPDRMVEAIRRLRAVVDGFYLAYPANIGPVCRYCSPANLGVVLRAIRTPFPSPRAP